MKKRSGRNFIRFFYHILVVLVMAMPMLSGLVRVIYVQSNKNAKDSYYGETINDSETYYSNSSELQINITYHMTSNPLPTALDSSFADSLRIVPSTFVYNGVSYNNIATIYFWGFGNSTSYQLIGVASNGDRVITLGNGEFNNLYFTASRIYYVGSSSFLSDFDAFYNIVYYAYSYLDNAFDYSIWKTMHDFTFHSDFRFTDIANGMLMTFDNNNLYIQYINFYINWVLTTAVISFAPYVLLTFYHLAIGLLDKFMKKGEDL